ncbi:hypothetical protein PEBR_36816 [Penicillium brasilianum]|uniref:Uncharacterized protein n=1 Tax=Penicillium brasilianum TaxID=104259 RepID=A0A1S9RBJ0_PENBI|nr:hypothetical protein PEBR_36816 [Penicillium brasilianum]
MRPPSNYTQSQSQLPFPPQPPNPRTTIFICVPLDNRTIRAYNASPGHDLKILLTATHALLVPNNRDVKIVVGDGPLAEGHFVPIRVDLIDEDSTDPDGEFDIHDEESRNRLIRQADSRVAEWMFRYRTFGTISSEMKIFLEEIEGFV